MEVDKHQFNSKIGKCNDEKEKRRKHGKKKKKFVKDAVKAVEELSHMKNPQEEENRISNDAREGNRKTKKKRHLLKENLKTTEEEEVNRESAPNGCGDGLAGSKKDKKKRYSEEADKGEEEQENIKTISVEEGILQSSDGKAEIRNNKRKKRLLKEAAKVENRGVCYLSRIPPHMNHLQLRHILSLYGDIQSIYLTPGRENAAAQVRRKRKEFLEGWVEFSDKRVAKRVANMLNGEEIGGKKRSSFYYDIWNIKYLSKFKWDDLTEEIAYKSAIREQKMALEISAAKKERDFYLSKVDKSRALSTIEERLKKKQKQQQDSGTNPDLPVIQQVSKVVRQFPQTRPIADTAAESKPRLSKDILSGSDDLSQASFKDILYRCFKEHDNLVKYAERMKIELIHASSSSSVPHFHAESSSSAPRRGPSKWSSKPKSKPKREKTKEEKTFRRRAKYFVVTQLVSVLLFLAFMGRPDDVDVELDDDDEGDE